MALGDLFRPKHKHSKAETRAAAVAAMGRDDLELLVEVAEGDPDEDIRKSAIDKIQDPSFLAQVADKQTSDKLRRYAKKLAVDIWVAKAVSTTDEDEGREAFNGAANHGDERAMAEIAGQAQLPELRSKALSRLEDPKALGQVVRKSKRPEEWRDALGRISDVEILRSIAVDEKRKEVAIAALERIDDEEVLATIASKAKVKSVRSRAKKEKNALAKAAEPVSTTSDEEKRERAERMQIARELETLAGGDEWIQSRFQATEFQERWEEMGSCEDEELQARFDKASARYEKNYGIYGPAALAVERKLAEEAARKAAEEEAKGAPEPSADEVIEPAGDEASSESESDDSEGADEAAGEGAAAEGAKKDEKKSVKSSEASAEEREANRDKLAALCEKVEKLNTRDKLKGFERSLKDLEKQRRRLGPIPKEAAEELGERFEAARRQALIRIGEIKEQEEWKRWSNVPKMEALIKRAKALLEDEAATNVGETLKGMQAEWKELGAAPREKGEELWNAFKAACDELYEKVKVERDQRTAEQRENLARKEELCEHAEELQSSTDWEATSAIFKELQAEWKTIGPVPRRKSDAIWKRFRAACDAFFEARAPHLQDKIDSESDNLEAKREILAKVEALVAEEGDLEEQIDAVKGLQRQWRDIGKVPRAEFEALNQAYRSACDAVFAKREAKAEAEKIKERELVISFENRIDECLDAGWDTEASEIAEKVLAMRSEYLQLAPDHEGYESLGTKLRALYKQQLETEAAAYEGSALDPNRSAADMLALIEEGEALLPVEDDDAGGKTPEEMAAQLKEALEDRALGGVLAKNSIHDPASKVEELNLRWSRIGPVPGPKGSELHKRFDELCDKLTALATDGADS